MLDFYILNKAFWSCSRLLSTVHVRRTIVKACWVLHMKTAAGSYVLTVVKQENFIHITVE